jgi:hypothetical protein
VAVHRQSGVAEPSEASTASPSVITDRGPTLVTSACATPAQITRPLDVGATAARSGRGPANEPASFFGLPVPEARGTAPRMWLEQANPGG